MSKVVYSHGMTKLQMVELVNRADMNNMGTKKKKTSKNLKKKKLLM